MEELTEVERKILDVITKINQTGMAAEQIDLVAATGLEKEQLLIWLNRLYQSGLITTDIPPRISKKKGSWGQVLDFGRIRANPQ